MAKASILAPSFQSRRGRYAALALGLALVQAIAFFAAFGTVMGRGDYIGPGAPLPRVPWLERALAVLMAPLFYLVPERWWMTLQPVIGDYVILAATLNAMLWGGMIAVVIHRIRSKTVRPQ